MQQTASTQLQQKLDEVVGYSQQDFLPQGRALSASLPSIMAVTALPAGRRASSPPPRQNSPVNAAFLPSSSQQSVLTTTNSNSKTAGRFSDAFSTIVGRTRTLSTDSKSRDVILSRQSQTQVQKDSTVESSFGIDADPFASRPSGPATNNSQSASDSPVTTNYTSEAPLHTKQRGSILFAASGALGFGRVSASISKRMSKRSAVDQSLTPLAPQIQPQSQQWRGLPWKGKGKPKGHWALQPPSSSNIVSDVIEISAAKSGLISVRDEEEENERDRLREAAAESIGISPLFREDASSRVTESDGMHYDDDSTEDLNSRASHDAILDGDASERHRILDRSRTSIAGVGISKQQEKPIGQQVQQARENRHNRSSSLSGIATPTTPSSSSHWPLPPLTPPILSANGRTPKGSSSATSSQLQLPPFPCLMSALGPLSSKSSSLLKFFPSPSLLLLGFSRQWRTRVVVLTTPPRPNSPSSSSFRPFTPNRLSSVYHLHLFKSSAVDERELERLEVNENSVVFIAEAEVAGKRSVVKVGGIDVGPRKREINVEENGQTMWLLSLTDANETQDWITVLKSAVLDQRAEKAGFAMPTHSLSASGPKGDLDVMLTMRAQDAASTTRTKDQILPRTSQEESYTRNTDSPAPTTRSWSSERRRPGSPSGRMVSLKGLFSVPGRTRSMSHDGPGRRHEDSPTSPIDAPSFTSRGTALLNMIRAPNGNITSGTMEKDPKPAHSSSGPAGHNFPVPIPNPGPILPRAELNLDKPSLKERDRDLPEWYSIQHDRGDIPASLNTGPALLPPPRNRRPWTSAGLLNNNMKQERAPDSGPPSRRSFQSAVSLHGARLSLEARSRPSSPDESLGTATGAFGAADMASKRASLSSSVSSFVSTVADREQLTGRSNPSIQRRMKTGKLPKMLTPPAGPPPSVPQPAQLSASSDDSNARNLSDRPPSRSPSLRSATNSDAVQNGSMLTGRRLSDSSAFSTGSMSTSASRGNYSSLRKSSNSLSPKRISIPPPPRPAPTSALPPTPGDADTSSQNGTPPRRSSFRESFSHRSLRFSLSPQNARGVPSRQNDSLRRRSASSGGSVSSNASSHASNVIIAPPAPPPTGPLPPTPRDPVASRYSIRERLRMKSAPSNLPPGMLRGTIGPPTTLPGSPPLVTVSSVASLKDNNNVPHVPIGEPITTIPKDLNFLNMSSPIDSSTPSTDDTDFLSISTPLTTSFPKQIPGKPSDYPPAVHSNGSPSTPEMTALPPPPRRGRNGTISEKGRDRAAQSLANNVASSAAEDIASLHSQLEPVTAK